MGYLIGGYVLIVVIYSIVRKANGYDAFVYGVKDGAKTVINMFSTLLAFVLVVECIKGCGIIEDLANLINPHLFIQSIIRPLSASSSLAIMLETFETYGVDSNIAILSTLLHATVDTTFYIIVLYFSSCDIKKYKYALIIGLVVIIIAYIVIYSVFMVLF